MKNCLRVLRAERGWSQARLAELLAVSRQTVNAIETEKYDPSLPLAFRIAGVFGARIDEIFDPGDEVADSPPGDERGAGSRQPAAAAEHRDAE